MKLNYKIPDRNIRSKIFKYIYKNENVYNNEITKNYINKNIKTETKKDKKKQNRNKNNLLSYNYYLNIFIKE